MIEHSPTLLASQKHGYWTLPPQVSYDFFGFRAGGGGALLLIGMHLTDSMPWLCARHPLCFAETPGSIDLESKRILGKRFRRVDGGPPNPLLVIDPIACILDTLQKAGHSFSVPPVHPNLVKTPGKLLPRRLNAEARILYEGQAITFYSRNFSEWSQCLHAELTLIFGLGHFLSELPKPPLRLQRFELETTLKPCKMCAAFLHKLRKQCVEFQVTYHEDDPGRLAADTLLDRYGYRSGY